MSQLDLLILVVYTITIGIVVIRSIESLDTKTKTGLNEAKLNESLEGYGLKDKIKIKFKFDDRYNLSEQPKQLALTAENKSDETLFIHWDQSYITDMDGRSRRVIRFTPNKTPDLSHPQVYSVIPPKSSLSETVTAEDVLAPDATEGGALKPTKPLLDIAGVKKAGEKSKDKKALYGSFEAGKAPLVVSLWLVVQTSDPTSARRSDRLYTLPCEFQTYRVPWTDALPWK